MSWVYSTFIYSTFIDPLLKSVRRAALAQVSPGMRVIDAACGTGDLVRVLAPRCREIVGVELDPGMVEYGNRKAGENQRFHVADASALPFGDQHFDLATISMAMHEMPQDRRCPVLRELLRVAPNVLVMDYAMPLPNHPVAWGARFIEYLAGEQHHAGFQSFLSAGGVGPLAESCGARATRVSTALMGVVELWDVRPVHASGSR